MESIEIFGIVILSIIALAISMWFVRITHNIARRNRYMEAQIQLLIKIAEKQGVSSEEIKEIENIYKEIPIM